MPAHANVTSLHPPTPLQAERRLHEAQRMFQRVLACWAIDALELRRRGAERHAWSPRIPGHWSIAA